MVLLAALLVVFGLGYLAQITGLCMVRGVREWMEGRPQVMLAILCCGVLAWTIAAAAPYLGSTLPFIVYEASPWFAIGGLLFGLGTAMNQGCGISTLTRLASGEMRMLTTPLGWLAGWCLLAIWSPTVGAAALPEPGTTTLAVLMVLTVVLTGWALCGSRFRKSLWFGMMGIGMLSGLLYLYEPGWAPSGLLADLSGALLHGEPERSPQLPRYLLVAAMVLGMSFGAMRLQKLRWRPSRLGPLLLHFGAGVLMGLGAALALGGNDSQLLLALPALSPAGFVTVGFMLLGIYLGLKLHPLLVPSTNKTG